MRVDMEWDSKYQVPANAKAVIVTPTLVADRFVQLTPAYDSGKVMKSGADIPVKETGDPGRAGPHLRQPEDAVERARPQRREQERRAVRPAPRRLEDAERRGCARQPDDQRPLQGRRETFGKGSGPLFDTVTQLSQFSTGARPTTTRSCAPSSRTSPASPASCPGERTSSRALLAALAQAVGTVKSFVHNNRNALSKNLKSLTEVVGVVAKQRDNLGTALEAGPLGAGNLALAYDTADGIHRRPVRASAATSTTPTARCAPSSSSPTIPERQQRTRLHALHRGPGEAAEVSGRRAAGTAAPTAGTPGSPSGAQAPGPSRSRLRHRRPCAPSAT